MNLPASSNSPGSPEECLASQETLRARDDRIHELSDKVEGQRIQIEDLSRLVERQTRVIEDQAKQVHLWQQSSQRFEKQCERLKTALSDIEQQSLTSGEMVAAGRRLLCEGVVTEGGRIVGRVAGEGYRATNG